MKQNVSAYLHSLLFILVSTLLTSSVLSLLYYYHILSTNGYENSTMVLGTLIFLFAGFFLGKKITKKALLHALAFIIPFFIVSFLYRGSGLLMSLVIVGKSLSYTIGTLVGRNTTNR